MASSKTLQVILKAKDEASKTLDNAAKKSKALKFGAGIATGAGAAALAVAVGLDKAANSAAGYGNQIVAIQRLTGGSAESSSKLAAMFRRLGIDGGGSARILKTLSVGINGNSKELKAAGIAAKDSRGHNRKASDVMRDLAQWYSKSTDKAKANAVASKLLGKGYASMLPVLAGGAKSIDDLGDAAKKNGEVMSGPQLAAVKAYGKAQKDAAAANRGMTMQVGLLVLPIKTLVTTWLLKFAQFLNNSAGFAKFKSWVGKMAAGILAFSASVKKWWASVKPAFDKFIAIVMSQLKPAWTSLQNAFKKDPAIMKSLKVVLMAVIAVLAILVIGVAGVIRIVAKMIELSVKLGAKVRAGFGAAKDAILNFVHTVTGPIDALLAKIAKLNPFHRNSPSLVDNVLAGTKVITRAYSGLGGINVRKPAFAMGGGMAGGSGGQIVHQHHIYLDGRELSRSLAKTVTKTGRTGER